VSCLPEFTYSVYVDGEATTEEARQVEAHLAVCTACRSLVEGLRAENRLLAEVLHESEESAATVAAPVTPIGPIDILWTGLAVLGTAAALQAALNWLSGVEVPAGVNWLNPFSVTVQWNLFFTSLFYFVEEGAAMLLSNVVTVSALVFTLLIAGAGLYLLRRRPSIATVLAALTLALGLALPASALETRKGDKVIVASEETIDDTLLIYADTVRIDGTVTGNVIAFGHRLEVGGTVGGDLLCFGGTTLVTGTVQGNIFAFSESVEVRGRVERSLHAFASMTRLEPSADIRGDVVAFTSHATADGTVGRDLYAFAGVVDVRGNVARNLRARVGRLNLLAPAKIGGNITARVKKEKNVQIDPSATVAGTTDIRVAAPEASPYLRARFYLRNILGLAVIFLLGLFLLWLFPAFRSTRLAGGVELVKTVGVGFLALVAPPVAALLLFILLIGIGVLAGVVLIATLIPLLITILWLLTLYLSKVLVGLALGRVIAKAPAEQAARVAMPLLIGLVVIYILINLPMVGLVVNLLVWLAGLGMGVRHAWRRALPA
jgi:cytoskeletal protein CcmA (bactofilin family)/predicted anti-sigma-YlaC factor YlaD